MSETARPLRADAERNRQAIICAAGTVFAQEGTTVTLERIACAAGVGVGTIYRRFPSVEDLLSVVLEEKMRRYADTTQRAADHSLHQPWEAFRDWIMFILEQQAHDLAFSDVLLSDEGSELFRGHVERALAASIVLVQRAREGGAVQAGFRHSDLLMLLHANAGVIKATHRTAPNTWKRLGNYILQALGTSGTPSQHSSAV